MIEIEPTFISENKVFAMGQISLKEHSMRLLNPAFTTVFICQSGWAIVSLYNKKYLFKKGDILIAYWDMRPVFLKVSESFITYYCMMSESLCYDTFQNISSSFCDLVYAYPVLKTPVEFVELLSHWIEEVLWINNNMLGNSRELLIKNSIQNLFLVIDSESQKIVSPNDLPAMPRAQEIVRQFCILLEKNSKRYHNVAFYAEKLSITPYYLSTITSKIMQDTPKGMIDKQIILEIKIILSTTDASLKMIAEQMNFEDTSYMCRFFRRHTGMSMLDFRKKSLSCISDTGNLGN